MPLVLVLILLLWSDPAAAEVECVLEFGRDEVQVVEGELRVDLRRKVRRECRGVDVRSLRLDRVRIVLDSDLRGSDGRRGRPRGGRGEVPIYRFFSGRQHMVSDRPDEGGARGYDQNEGVLFSLYPREAPGRRAVYACFVPSQNDHFLSIRSDCEGQRVERLLGYVAVRNDGPAKRALYRCYRGKARDHLMTTNPDECTRNGYAVEPILGYVP